MEKSVTFPSARWFAEAPQVMLWDVHMNLPAAPPDPVTPAVPVAPAVPTVPAVPVPAAPVVPAVPVRWPDDPPQFEDRTMNESTPPIATSADTLRSLATEFPMLVVLSVED